MVEGQGGEEEAYASDAGNGEEGGKGREACVQACVIVKEQGWSRRCIQIQSQI